MPRPMGEGIVAVRRRSEPWRVLVYDAAAVPMMYTPGRLGTTVRVGERAWMFNGEEVLVAGIQYRPGHPPAMHKDGTWMDYPTVLLQHASLFQHWYVASMIGAIWIDVHLPDEET